MTERPETRLAPVPAAQWDEHTRAVLLSHLRRPELYLSGAPDAPPMPVVLELFAHHLPLSETWLDFSDMLAGDDARVPAAHRELLILRVAWRSGSGYEWHQHRRMGAEAGLSKAQLAAVPEGAGAAIWSPLERTLLEAVDEFVDHSSVSDATWDALTTSFEPAQLLELLFVIGGYLCLAGVLNSIGLRGDALPSSASPPGARRAEVSGS